MAQRTLVLCALALSLLAAPSPAGAEIRISNLSVFFNDFDVTVQVVLLGAIPDPLPGKPPLRGSHPHTLPRGALAVQPPLGGALDPEAAVERQLTYNVLTKEYRVTSLEGEQREPYLTKNLREAQRVLSDLRVSRLAPGAALDSKELYYVRVRSDVSLNGDSSWAGPDGG